MAIEAHSPSELEGVTCYGVNSYYTDNKFEHDRYGSCKYEDYGDGYYDNYYHGRNYNCCVDHHNYDYDDYYGYEHCRFNHYKYKWKDVKEKLTRMTT